MAFERGRGGGLPKEIKGTGAVKRNFEITSGKIAGVTLFGGGSTPQKIFLRGVMGLNLVSWGGGSHTICK